MNTREKILDVALHMFSERGYEAVSVRDICGEVGIKESTMYYHFRNKQDILDSLIEKFENYTSDVLGQAQFSTSDVEDEGKPDFMDSYMMDSYLFDPFCNLMLRMLMIEQFHNEKVRALYEKKMFTEPFEIQKGIFRQFVLGGLYSEEEVDWIVKEYFSYMTMLTYRYLLNGELTEERKGEYSREVHDYFEKVKIRWAKG